MTCWQSHRTNRDAKTQLSGFIGNANRQGRQLSSLVLVFCAARHGTDAWLSWNNAMLNFISSLNAEGPHTSLDKVELERRFPQPACASLLSQAAMGARVGRQRVIVFPNFEPQRLHRPVRGRTTRLLLL